MDRAPALQAVGREQPAGAERNIELWAARGEYEAAQIVVRAAAGGVSGLRVEASSLAGPRGASIPESSVALYRVHYFQVVRGSPDLHGSNRPAGSGWYADPLIPFFDPQTR